MRKARRNLLLAGLVAVPVVGGLTWLIVRNHEPPEPVYQGKPLSYWLAFLDAVQRPGVQRPGVVRPPLPPQLSDHATGSPAPTYDQAKEAVTQIGTNAIPSLLRMLRAHDSRLKLKLIGLVQKQHLLKINFVTAEQRYSEASRGFYFLGTAASNAVPALIQIFEENISPGSQLRAAGALQSIGPAGSTAVPVMLRTVADTKASAFMRGVAASALGHLHAEPDAVVPTLTKCLTDSETYVRPFAANALASFGKDAKAAVPALIDLLKDPNPAVREQAQLALKAIAPEAAAKAGIQ